MAQKESAKLEKKLEDMKLVSRAKLLLITNLGISEESAHKYIEKEAMDSRLTRVEVAQTIIKQYD